MIDKRTPRVSIIILNYNGWKDTIACLESVFNIDYQEFCVIVVDNGSYDNSVEYLRKWADGNIDYEIVFPDHPYFEKIDNVNKPVDYYEYERKEIFRENGQYVDLYEEIFIPKATISHLNQTKLIIIETKHNLGYAGGNNVGIRYSINYLNVDYIMILNNDTVIAPNLLKKLLEIFTRDTNVGICGPVEYSYQNPFDIQSAGGNFGLYTGSHIVIKNLQEKIQEVDWVCGSCMLINKDLFHKVGYFDERYFLYYEEIDYAYRTQKSGYKTVLSSETCIWHKGGVQGTKTFDGLFLFYDIRNRLLFSLKHLRFYQLLFFIPYHVRRIFTYSIRELLCRRQINFMTRLHALKEGFAANNEKINHFIVKK